MGRKNAPRALVVVLALSALSAKCGSSPTYPTPVPTPEPPPPPPALTITCPGNQTGMSIQNQPVTVSWVTPSTGGGTAPIETICTPASGSVFLPGSTTVSCTASDSGGQRTACGFTVTITRPPQLTVTKFLAFGDSITWGKDTPPAPFFAFPEPPPVTSYPTQLLGLLRGRYLDQMPVMVNEGWPGEAVEDGLRRLPSALSSSTPQVLLLLDGANDLLNRPRSSTTWYISGKLQEMIQTAKRRIPGIRVLLATFPPQYHGTIPYDRGAGADFVPELNGRIAEVARLEDATLVDLYTPLLPDLKQNIGGDGLHPTVKGFTLMAETFFAAIQQTLEQTADDGLAGVPAVAPITPGAGPGSMPARHPRLPATYTGTPARSRWSAR